MTIINKEMRNIHRWLCVLLVFCMLLGQFPWGVTATQTKEFSITGINAYNFRGNDWYIILATDNADFSLSAVASLTNAGVTIDGEAASGWFQIGTGTLAFTLGTDKADHKVVLPAGMVLNGFTLKEDYVFFTQADGSVKAGASVTGINAYNFRGNDWYIILDTDQPALSLPQVSSLTTAGVTVDGTVTSGWFQATSGNAGKVAFTLATDKADHKVVIPQGTVLGNFVLAEDYVFCTYADGSVAPATFNITGIKAYNFRGKDWYIILNTDNAKLNLSAVASLTTAGVTIDGEPAAGWFQKTTGTLEFSLTTGKEEHKIVLPAGMELGNYVLATEYVFYTHDTGYVDTQAGDVPETTEPETTQPEGKTLSITGINAYNFRGNDWYMILNTDVADFALTAISGLKAPVDNTTAQVWFQINSQLSVPAGSFGLTLAVDKAEHTVTLPAGTVLGEYTLKEDFVFCTHADGTLTVGGSEQETTEPETTEPETTEPETTQPEGKTLSVIGINAYNFRGNDWYIILNTDVADFALTAISGIKAPVDNTTAQVWFQINSQLSVPAGSFGLTLAVDKAEHTVTLPAGTVLGEYTLKEDFVFCTHADGTLTVGGSEQETTEPETTEPETTEPETTEPETTEPETTEPETTQPEGKTLSIIGINAYNFRGSDWYIILNTDVADFELTAISGIKAPMDNTTAQVWFQINSQLGVPAGSFGLTLAADRAEHEVTIPAGTVLGDYTLENAFVFYTHADGSVDTQAGDVPETTEPETTEPASEPEEKAVSITGINAYNFRGSDWYIILNTDIADFELTAISGIKAPMDNTTAQVWFQINSQLGVPAGSFGLTLAADKAEHEVTIPAGTVLGDYTLENAFVFYTHADSSVDTQAGDVPETTEPAEPTTAPATEPDDGKIKISGFSTYTYRPNNGDWYLTLNVDAPAFALASVVGIQTPVDDTTAQVWFQSNAAMNLEAGQLALTLAVDKAEHKVTIPAGTVLGEYILEEEFIFYTHGDGTVDQEEAGKSVKITGISLATYREKMDDWYIVLDTDAKEFALSAVAGAQLAVDDTTAQVWFQSNAAMNLEAGQLALTLAVDKAEHKVTIPAGTVLGKYILEEEFVFYTHGDNTADQEAADKVLHIAGISLATYREKMDDWYIVLDTDAKEFALSAVAGVQLAVDDTTAQVWFQSNAALQVEAGKLALTLAVDKAEHKVTIPAGTVLGKYILEEEFVFYTHGDNTADQEAADKVLHIAGISLATYRENIGDWYIVLDADAKEFALSAVAGAQLPVDDTTAQVWFQSNAALKVEAGKLALTLAANKAEHKVTIPAGTVLGKYILETEFVFYVYPDGTGGDEPLPDPVSFRLANGAWQFVPENELARYLITLEDDQIGEKTIPWTPYNCLSIDGEERSVFAFAEGSKLVLILDEAAGITRPGKHTIVLRKGAYIGNYQIAQDVTFYTDGLTVTTTEPKPIAAPTETVSVKNDSRNLNSLCTTGFYFGVEPDDQLPFDDQKGSIRYSAAEGGIYVNGKLTPVTVSKWLSNLYYVPLSEFGYPPQKGDVVTIDGVFGNGDHAVTFAKQSFVYDGEGNWEIGTYLRDLREQEYQIQDISELKLGLSEFEVKPGVQLIGEAASGTNIAIRAIVSTNLDATEFNLGFSKLEGMWDNAGWQVWIRPKFNQVYLAHGEVDWQVTNHYEFTDEEFVVEFGTVNMDEYKDGQNTGLYCRKIFLKINGEEVLSYMDTDLDREVGKKLYALNSQDAVDNKLISLTSEGVALRQMTPTVYDYYDLTGFVTDTIPGGKTLLLGQTLSSSNVAVRMQMNLDGNATEVRLALSKQNPDNFWDEAGSGWQVWLRPKWDTAYIAHGTNDHEVIKPFPYAGTYTVEMGVQDVVVEKDGKRIGNYCRRVYLLVNGEEIASWEDMDFSRPIGNCVMLLTSQDSAVSLATLKKTANLAVETVINGQSVDRSDYVDVTSQVIPGKPAKISVLYRSDYNNKVTLKGLYLNGTLLTPEETEAGKQVYTLDAPAETDQLRVELEVKELTVDEPVQIFDLFDTSGKASVEVRGKHYGVSLGAMVGPEGQAAVNSAVRFRLQLPNQFNQVPICILGDVSTLWGNSGALFQITPSQVHFCHTASMTRLASFASSWFAPGSNVCVELGIVKCYENGLYRYDRWYVKAGQTEETMEMVAWYDSVERGHYGGHFCCNGTDMEESYFLYSLKNIYTIEDVSTEENKTMLRSYQRWSEVLPELYYSAALEGYADVETAQKVGIISFFTKPGTSLSAFLVNGRDVTKDVQIGADGAYCYTIQQLNGDVTFAYEIAEDAATHTVTVETAQGLETAVDQTQVLTGDDVVLTVTAQKGIVPQVTANGTQIDQMLRFDPETGIWSCTLRSIRQDTTIQVNAEQRSYTVSVQEDANCTVELGGDVAEGKLPFGGTLELKTQIADGYYVEYILVGDQKFAVDADGKLVVDRVYIDLQELVIRPVIKNSEPYKQTESTNMTVIWIGVGAVCVLTIAIGGILIGRKTKRKADKNEAE